MDEFVIATTIEGINVKGLCRVTLAKFVEFEMMEPYANVTIQLKYNAPENQIQVFYDQDHASRFTIDHLGYFLRQADILKRNRVVAQQVYDLYHRHLDRLLKDVDADPEAGIFHRHRFKARRYAENQAHAYLQVALMKAIPELRQALTDEPFIISPKIFAQIQKSL